LNTGSQGYHSNSKTGDGVDVEDHEDDCGDDAIDGGGEKEQKL